MNSIRLRLNLTYNNENRKTDINKIKFRFFLFDFFLLWISSFFIVNITSLMHIRFLYLEAIHPK